MNYENFFSKFLFESQDGCIPLCKLFRLKINQVEL